MDAWWKTGGSPDSLKSLDFSLDPSIFHSRRIQKRKNTKSASSQKPNPLCIDSDGFRLYLERSLPKSGVILWAWNCRLVETQISQQLDSIASWLEEVMGYASVAVGVHELWVQVIPQLLPRQAGINAVRMESLLKLSIPKIEYSLHVSRSSITIRSRLTKRKTKQRFEWREKRWTRPVLRMMLVITSSSMGKNIK